uniref:non-specific serine/threonine protein kinase n=2 Tax=Macrostomum lignano TaxID=282301 RepID=A0A1I8J804_9PLAT
RPGTRAFQPRNTLASCNSQQSQRQRPSAAPIVDEFDGGCNEDISELNGELHNFITRLDETSIVYVNKPPKLLQDRYLLDEKLGEGSYGKVKLCVDRQTGDRLAVKIVTIRLVRKIPQGLETVEREAATMRQLKHVNTVRLYADFSDEQCQKRYLVMEFAVCSIHDLQSKGMTMDAEYFRCLPESQARHYFAQLLDGVEYLHNLRIVHKDLKPGNLLLTADHTVKITDFGVCEQLPESALDDTITGTQATPAIQPPEVADGSKQFSGFRLDIYCAGVCLYFMVCGRVPYREKNVLLIYERIAEGRYTIESWVSEACQQLIGALMAYTAADRPDPAKARQFDWLQKQSAAPVPGQDWIRLESVCEVEDAAATVARVRQAFEERMHRRSQYETHGLSLASEAALTGEQPDDILATDDEDDGIDFKAGGARCGQASSGASTCSEAPPAPQPPAAAPAASTGRKKRRCCLS